MRYSIKVYIYALITILLWGSVPAISKLVLNSVDVFSAVFFTTFFAALGLFFILLLQGNLKTIKKYNLNDFKKMILIGFISPFLYIFSYYIALLHITATEVNILNYLWPVFVLLLSFFMLKEKITFRKILGILIGFLGAIIVISKGNFSFLSSIKLNGYLIAIFGAVCFGLFSVYGKKLNYERISSMFFYVLSGFIFTSIVTFLFSSVKLPNFYELIGLFHLGFFVTGLGNVFWFKALKDGETAKMSNLMFLVPFVGLVFIYFLLKEEIPFLSVVGLLVIILGILIQKRTNIP